MMLVLLAAIESALMAYALCSSGPFRLRGLIAVNIVLISLLASKLVSIGGFVTNVGSVLYATVVLAQIIIFDRFGKQAAVDTIRMTLYALVAALTLSYVVAHVPTVYGNEDASFALLQISDFSLRVVLASFFAFVLGQAALIISMEKFQSYATSVLLVQIVDSAIFFPVAFGIFKLGEMTEILMVGLFLKVFISLPIYLLYTAFSYAFGRLCARI